MTPQVSGRLHLNFGRSPAGRTILRVCDQQPPLKVIRAFDLSGGAALVHLHNISGGVLGGDRLELKIDVDPGAWAQVTTPSATRIYRQRTDKLPSIQINTITVEANGVLEMLPDPLIPFAGSTYRQQTRITLAENAGLFWWEIVTPGREARGERFAYNSLELQTSIGANGRPIALEAIRLEPRSRSLTSALRIGNYTHFATFYVCQVGWTAANWTALESELMTIAESLSEPGETSWGVSTLVAHGFVVRALGRNNHAIAKGLFMFWDTARRALYNQVAIAPRKMY